MIPRLFMKMGVLLGGAALIVTLYNYWAYCCGRCRAEHFWVWPPLATLLLLLNLGCLFLWIFLVRRNKKRGLRSLCGCGAILVDVWRYCPSCGLRSSAKLPGSAPTQDPS